MARFSMVLLVLSAISGGAVRADELNKFNTDREGGAQNEGGSTTKANKQKQVEAKAPEDSAMVAADLEADRAIELMLTQSELASRASTRVVHLPAIDTGLQSGITSVGNKPQSDAARHSFSGGAASARGHLAQATGIKGLTDSAPAILLNASVVLLGFVALGCFSFGIHRLSATFCRQPTAQAKGRKAPSTQRQEWSHGNSRMLGPAFFCEKFFAGKAQFIVGEVSAVTGALNSKVLAIEEGYCIVRSKQMQQCYLLWRDDMKAKAYAALNIKVPIKSLPTANDEDLEATETVAPLDETALYESLRQLSKRIQGPLTKFPSGSMNALFQEKQSRYIVVKPSCDSNPSIHWRNAQVNFFLTKGDFEQGAEPHRSVCVCDIVNVSWYCQPLASDPQIVLTTNQQAPFSGSCSSDSFRAKETYLGRQTQDATAQLQKDLLELSDMVKLIE